MKELFDGLDDLGFGVLDDLEPFKEVAVSGLVQGVSIASTAITPEECIFDKTYECPVCDKKFKEKTVKTSKAKYVRMEDDLMPVYDPLYPFFYNVVLCPFCGYATLTDNFFKITSSQAKLIKNNITPKFKSKEYTIPFSEDDVIERYKLALLNSLVKKCRASERGYICLVISWLYKIKENEKNRILFINNAYEGLLEGYGKDAFPIYGMNEVVLGYLLGELARIIGDEDEAMRWAGRVIGSRLANPRIKDMARDLKERINKQREEGFDK